MQWKILIFYSKVMKKGEDKKDVERRKTFVDGRSMQENKKVNANICITSTCC